MQAIGNIIGLQLVATVHGQTIAGQIAIETVVGSAKITQAGANDAAGGIPATRNQLREIGLFLLVDDFARQAHIAGIKFFRHAQADLATRNRVISGVAIVTALLEVSADMEIQIVCEVRPIFGIHAVIGMINAKAEANRTATIFAGLANQVDNATGAVGGKCRGGTTAHGFDARQSRI